MTSILLSLFVWLALAPSAESASFLRGGSPTFPRYHPCPSEHANSETRVRNLLSSPLLPEMRARYALGSASAENVQLLTSAHDRDTCRALWAALAESGTSLAPGDQVSFYRSGDTFFVPITRSRRPGAAGAVQLDGSSSLDVYDAGFRLIGRFGA
jgi:hypothetical protein